MSSHFVIKKHLLLILWSFKDKIAVSSVLSNEVIMLLVNLKALMERKSAIEGKRVTYKTIEEATGIRALTLSRIATNPAYNVSRADIEKLLHYFDCQPNDLFSLLKDKRKK